MAKLEWGSQPAKARADRPRPLPWHGGDLGLSGELASTPVIPTRLYPDRPPDGMTPLNKAPLSTGELEKTGWRMGVPTAHQPVGPEQENLGEREHR